MVDTLKYAKWYLSKGFSVFPVIPARADSKGKDMKRPACKWTEFQTRRPTEGEVEKWWSEHPDNRIGIATGVLSGILVVDCDDEAAHSRMEDEYLSDTVKTPIAKSPHGWHYYFRHVDGVRNEVKLSGLGMDIRAEGGFIMAPPSGGLNGVGYKWQPGFEPWTVALGDVPASLLQIIKSSSSLSSSYKQGNTILYSNIARGVPETGKGGLDFAEGSRDHTIFHVANALVKGGMPENEIQQLLELIALKVCDPPFDATEIPAKIKSALNREERAERTLAEEVRDWVCRQDVVIMSSDVVKNLGLSSRVVKKNLSKIMARLCEEGIIEKYGKRGEWRVIDRSYKEQCWWQDEGKPLPINFPLGIGDFVKLYSGNIVLLEGQKSQGKSAFALEFCRMNKGIFAGKILYQNVEMADSELLERFRAYGDIMPLEEWKQSVTFIRQTQEWWDKILPDGLNVVDYLIEYEKTYLVADYIWKIHQKLKSGIALVIVQRDPMKPYPTGGRGVRDIPRAIISLIKHKVRLEDVKSFYQTAYGNPSGLCRKYKQVNWWNFKADSEWDQEEETKYEQFKKR